MSLEKHTLAVCACLFLFWSGGHAQEEILFMGEEMGVGARAMGMGGAFTAVADDYSAIYWNPAGLGQIRRLEANIGFTHNKISNTTEFLDVRSKENAGFSRLNSIGIVIPVPTYQGSLVFGLGYNRVREYDDVFKIEGYNRNHAAFADIVVPTYAEEWTTDIHGDVYQQELINEEGSRDLLSLSGAMELQKNLYFGATVDFTSGMDRYDLMLDEDDINNVHSYYSEKELNMSDLDYWIYDQQIKSRFSATQLKLAAMYRFNTALKVGATVTIPTKYTIKENWKEKQTEYYDGLEDAEIFEDEGEYEYQVKEPYEFTGGVSLMLLNILLSGTVEFKDWTQAVFLTDPPVIGTTKEDVNTRIKWDMQPVTRYRFGAEMYVPLIKAKIRAGVFNSPSPYKYLDLKPDKYFLTTGASLMLGKQTMVDFAYIHGNWEQESSDDLTMWPARENISYSKFTGTLSVRF